MAKLGRGLVMFGTAKHMKESGVAKLTSKMGQMGMKSWGALKKR